MSLLKKRMKETIMISAAGQRTARKKGGKE